MRFCVFTLNIWNMDFLTLAKSRYSCRNYKSDTISDDLLYQVLEAFRIAPSAVNFQPWHIIVVKNFDNLSKVHEAYNREWFKTAPVVLVICGDHQTSWKRGSDNKNHLDIDIAIAIDHLTLQASALGLATCWVCNFKPDIIKESFSLPQHIEPIALIPLGFPNDHANLDRFDSKRKKLNEIVSWEKY
jgi:nitroreductase